MIRDAVTPSSKLLVKEFRSVLSESGINDVPIDDELLLCFINYRNEDLVRTLKAVKGYISYKDDHPELSANLQSTCPQLLVSSIFHRVSPRRDQHGRVIYLVPVGIWRDDLSTLEDILRVAIHDFQIMVSDIETQKNGLVAIIDFKNFGMAKMKDMTPVFLKKVAILLQGAFPIKIKGLHFVNHSWLLKIIILMIWPFLSNKLRSRLYFHNNYSSLHKKIDASCLPCEYNGDLGPLLEMGTAEEVINPPTKMFDCLNNSRQRITI